MLCALILWKAGIVSLFCEFRQYLTARCPPHDTGRVFSFYDFIKTMDPSEFKGERVLARTSGLIRSKSLFLHYWK